MKVFISSVISGYEPYRNAVQDAVTTLGHQVIRAEEFGASSASPQIACLSGIREADLVILLLGRRYGAPQASGLSATHEEFHEARDRKEVLAFVETVGDRESRQRELLSEVQDWNAGLFTESYTDTETLRRAVTKVLHQRELEDARGAHDPAELLQRSLALIPEDDRRSFRGRSALVIALAGSPQQNLLRPAEIEGQQFADAAFQISAHGRYAIIDRREGTKTEVVDSALVLTQPSRSIGIHPDGSILVRFALDSHGGMIVIIEDDVRETIARAIGLLNDILNLIDPTECIRHVCIAAGILNSEYAGWRTREEHLTSPNSMTMGMGGEKAPIHLVPPARPRAAIRTEPAKIAEDLTILIRRQFSLA